MGWYLPSEAKRVLKEKNKEIEQLKQVLRRNRMKEEMEQCEEGFYNMVEKRDKEIKQLKKEKEWLLNSYVQIQHMPNSLNMADKNQIRGDIIRRMQKAIKGGEDGKRRQADSSTDKTQV